jgi:phosphodiesterase/alkaline phosphatase D-like protein
MKIAVTSCYKKYKPKVWENIRSKNPDMMLFLGDFVYLDGIGDKYDKSLNNDKKNEIFEDIAKMYRDHLEYPPFKSLYDEVDYLATWDDHDFQKNGALGSDITLDEVYINTIRSIFLKTAYGESSGEIYRFKDIETSGGKVRIIVLDVRTYRNPEVGGRRDIDPTMLGQTQMDWLEQSMMVDHPVLICSGSTLNSPPRKSLPFISNKHCKRESRWLEHWESYEKLIHLMSNHGRCLFISGDIHKNEFVFHQHGTRNPFYEITASGVSAGWFQNGRYAILNIESNEMQVEYYEYNEKQGAFSIDRTTWHLNNRQSAEQSKLYRDGGEEKYFNCALPR